MIGFGAVLSTQHAFLLLKEEIFEKKAQGEHLPLAQDLKGAFDNGTQEVIPEELRES